MRKLPNAFSMIVLALIAAATGPSGGIGAAEPAALRVSEGPTSATIRAGDRTLLEYRTAASPMKPYIRELYTPGGVQILRDALPDHKHHHGLMFALGVDGVNFWEEAAEGRKREASRSSENSEGAAPRWPLCSPLSDPRLDRRPRQETPRRTARSRSRGAGDTRACYVGPVESGTFPGRRTRVGET